jgi:hypothetical protein
MGVWTQEFRARVGKVEDKGNYSTVNLSVSEKNKEGEYVFSDFSFVRFFSEAHALAKTLKEGDVITVTSCKITKQSYMKDGKKEYPKNDSWNVFKADMYKAKGAKVQVKAPATAPVEEPLDDGDIPF